MKRSSDGTFTEYEGVERETTGIPGLDQMMEGGYPAGGLITLTGRPGTGKTIFSSQFLYDGCKNFGEPGMYVSMIEGKKAYLSNARRLGLDLESMEKKGLFRFLEMPTTTADGLSSVLAEIVKWVAHDNTKRLVIDSFTAMAHTFTSRGDMRIFTHTLLGKVVAAQGCTTFMISELSPANIGFTDGIEEFIADGVITFTLEPVSGDGRVRYIEIVKMRGTNQWMGPIPVEISGNGMVVKHPYLRAKPRD